MIKEAKSIYEKATIVEDKVGFLRKIPWWAYLLGAGAVWYFFSEPKEEKVTVVDDT